MHVLLRYHLSSAHCQWESREVGATHHIYIGNMILECLRPEDRLLLGNCLRGPVLNCRVAAYRRHPPSSLVFVNGNIHKILTLYWLLEISGNEIAI
jgi:hypothetical protein